ncbi:extracellular solute-binding protein [Candidatus Persebacteraceae bacterium Df01]|jgi:putative spermidine/putrescine transport system substrate-binding protein|uniref:Extracellular solute-binding protein n=1 Tax=Candidatus Doriopsillibacter californiensis TaxID=2970740 RepID=A0ABT7QLE7_9GAMM|nr:extracellular solute-binding protein [Candidatus Persebacteraceae bacterium Df01]
MNTTTKKIVASFAATALIAGNALAAKDIELTIVSWGGAYTDSQQNAYHAPYMKANPHVSIINDDSSNEAVPKLRAQNEAGNINWDLVDMVPADAIRACDEGIVIEIDFDKVLAPAPDGTSPTQDFGASLVSPCFIPQIVYSTTFGYRSDVAEWGGKKPTSIKDVFDTKNFPGKRSLEKRPVNNMEWALIADGVSPDQVYDALSTPEGVDRAFAKLDTIKDDIIWWSSGADTPDRLAKKEVVMGSTYNGRLFALIEEQKQPVEMMWDWQIFELDGWVIPAGLPKDRLQAVLDYLYYATDTQRLADQSKYISYGPARQSSAPLVGKHATLDIDMAPHMPTDPNNAKNTLYNNIEWWADNRDELDQRFQAWLDQ